MALPRLPRVRSYVQTGRYVPKSGPLAGQVFTGTPGTTQAYNRYQAARSKALGFTSYRQERQVRAYARSILATEKETVRFGRAGVLNAQHRTEILAHVAKFYNPEIGGVDTYRRDAAGNLILGANGRPVQDRSFGGKLDQYLIGLRRRTGTETWHPGETPK